MKQFANITVLGRDKTGVVAKVASFLFEQGANIEGLEEQVTRGQFSMTIQASWKRKGWQPERLRSGLDRLAKALQMEIRLRYTQRDRLQRCAIMATREPHCLAALAEAFSARRIKAEPVLVVGNRRDLEPLARRHRLPFLYVPWHDRARAEARVLREFDQQQIDFVVLARFMKILSPAFVWRFKNKIINIHPSLLPSFPGPQAYRQAYEHGVKIIGATAHFVSMHLDEGPIIAQSSYPVRPNSTLEDLVLAGQKLEAKVLLKAVKLYLAKRLDVHWGIVKQV
ncbi:MAG: formyltetrahydrofolate deformylase [Verrucomicrobia subdivision 3 bacterium]|nr:formyltetrahydrofolate deformylase [Limisphaerales bacterium]